MEIASRRWAANLVAMGKNTGPYQLEEGKHHLARGVVEVLAEFRNPFSILTKSTLAMRDLLLLAEVSRRTYVRVNPFDRDAGP